MTLVVDSFASIPLLVRAANLLDESFMITTAKMEAPGPQIVYVNQAFTTMTGYTASEVVGKSPRILQGEATSRATLRRLRNSLTSGSDFDGRLMNYRKDGSAFLMEVRIRPIRDEHEDTTHYFAVQKDVSREAEELAQNRRLQEALDQSLDSVLAFGPDGRVHYANAAYLTWAKMTEDEVLGQGVWRLPGFPNSREDLAWARRRLGQGLSWQREYEVKVDLGSFRDRRTVFTSVSPVQLEEGGHKDFIAICRDVTERCRLFEIAQAHNQVDQLEQMFAVIRHEVGNPVNSIKSALTILSSPKDPLSDRQSLYITRILEEVARLEFLLTSLRSFGQFERLHLRPLALSRLTERLEAVVGKELSQRGVSFQVVMPQDGLAVIADEQGLLHALAHVVHNAMDGVAKVDKAQIRMEAQAVEGRIYLSVLDNGVGIPSEDLQRVKGPFFTTKKRRAGLGLSVVNKLVSRMRGGLSIDSNHGAGTVVTIDLEMATESNLDLARAEKSRDLGGVVR